MKKRYRVLHEKSSRDKDTAGIEPLKGFFKAGENYIPHLSKKARILSRILETEEKKQGK